MRLLARIFLSILLGAAGVLHIIRPEIFDPIIPFVWKWEINLIGGIIEILLAVGFWIPKLRDLAGKGTALWFLILIPFHVYMIYAGIPIFGYTNPFVLWGRLFFQPVLYFLALITQDKGWIMSQRWKEVVFLHYEVDAEKLQKLVPFPLDLYEGKAIVSIVPFIMSHIRFPFLPAIPGLSSLRELNLRTYVKMNGVSAIYFFTLDANHLPGVLIARWFFALPYRLRKLEFSRLDTYDFSSPEFDLKAEISETVSSSEFERWASERYALLTKRGSLQLCGVVEHKPWTLQKINVLNIKNNFSSEFGVDIDAKAFIATGYSRELNVRFRPFRKI